MRSQLQTKTPKIMEQRSMGNTTKEITVQHDQIKKKFFIKLKSDDEALLEYNENPKGILEMYHTEVPINYRGYGLGNVLAKVAFDHVVTNDLKMRLTCTFLQKYLKDNPQEKYVQRSV